MTTEDLGEIPPSTAAAPIDLHDAAIIREQLLKSYQNNIPGHNQPMQQSYPATLSSTMREPPRLNATNIIIPPLEKTMNEIPIKDDAYPPPPKKKKVSRKKSSDDDEDFQPDVVSDTSSEEISSDAENEREDDDIPQLSGDDSDNSDVLPDDTMNQPKTVYQFFQKCNRKRLVEEHPSAPISQIRSMLTRMWRSLSEEEKAQYRKMHYDAKFKRTKAKNDYISMQNRQQQAQIRQQLPMGNPWVIPNMQGFQQYHPSIGMNVPMSMPMNMGMGLGMNMPNMNQQPLTGTLQGMQRMQQPMQHITGIGMQPINNMNTQARPSPMPMQMPVQMQMQMQMPTLTRIGSQPQVPMGIQRTIQQPQPQPQSSFTRTLVGTQPQTHQQQQQQQQQPQPQQLQQQLQPQQSLLHHSIQIPQQMQGMISPSAIRPNENQSQQNLSAMTIQNLNTSPQHQQAQLGIPKPKEELLDDSFSSTSEGRPHRSHAGAKLAAITAELAKSPEEEEAEVEAESAALIAGRKRNRPQRTSKSKQEYLDIIDANGIKRTVPLYMPEDPKEIDPNLDWYCRVCKRWVSDDENNIMCSNEDCNQSYHLQCVGLNEPPSGDWFCPDKIGCHFVNEAVPQQVQVQMPSIVQTSVSQNTFVQNPNELNNYRYDLSRIGNSLGT